ncbi:hypothetical protein OROGR_020259 [Orobanche gracilis]
MTPSSSAPPPSSKLIITDPNPKSRPKPPPAAPPNCASSSSTTATPPPDKRTRDQPNFSDCHCCGRRINNSNPKDRLQPLDSVWRIVLLCRKCRRDVHSGQTCPYCFRITGASGEFLTCSACERKIHKDCVSDYGNCTPWCYLGVGSDGFRICVDCWVPGLLKNSTRVRGRCENKGGMKDKGEYEVLLENVVKNAKSEVEKKVKSKTKVGKNDTSELMAKKEKDSLKAENSNQSGSFEVAEDAEVAIQLHRAINSSPRILMKSLSDLDVSSIMDWNGLSYKKSLLGKNCTEDQNTGTSIEIVENESMNRLGEIDSCINWTGSNMELQCYKRDKTRKIWQLSEDNHVVSESRPTQPAQVRCNLISDDAKIKCSVSSDVGIPEASIRADGGQNNVHGFSQELVIYRRRRFKRNLFQVNGPIGGSRESSSLNNQGTSFKHESCQIYDGELRVGCQVKSDGTEVIFPSGNCDGDHDRCHLKYCRRATFTKSVSSFLHFSNQNQAYQHTLINSDGGSDKDPDRYNLKYAKRATGTKHNSSFQHYNTLLSENQAFEPALNKSVAGCSMTSDGKLMPQIGTGNQDPDRYCVKYTKKVKSSEIWLNIQK